MNDNCGNEISVLDFISLHVFSSTEYCIFQVAEFEPGATLKKRHTKSFSDGYQVGVVTIAVLVHTLKFKVCDVSDG